MWSSLIQKFSDDEVTIDVSGSGDVRDTVNPVMIGGMSHLIFKEHQLKYCSCTDRDGVKQVSWRGKAEYECHAELTEMENERLPYSRTYLCSKSGHHITVIKNSPKEREMHKDEFQAIVFD